MKTIQRGGESSHKRISGRLNRRVVLSILLCSAIGSVSPLFGYRALRFLDYPTVIIAKSCKLIPVLLMKVLLFKRKVPTSKYLVILLVTVGLYTFMRNQSTAHHSVARTDRGSNALAGLGLVGINLALDGLINSIQDQVFYHSKITGPEMMFLMGISSSVLLGTYLSSPYVTELSETISFLSENPGLTPYILLFTLCGALGQCFVYYTLQELGSLSLVTLTMTRKMASILLNIVLFRHHLSRLQWFGVLVVLSGITLDSKTRKLSAHPGKKE